MIKLKNLAKTKFWNLKKINDDVGEVMLYSVIDSDSFWGDETTPENFSKDLDSLGDIKTLNIYINSPGGDIFAGYAICSILNRKTYEKIAYIDGLGASIASVIPMCCDKVYMYTNTMMMIHKPWSSKTGNATTLRTAADRLDKIEDTIIDLYLKRVNLDKETISKMLEDETWLSAEECVKHGFADEILGENKVVACIDPELMKGYKNLPESIKNMINAYQSNVLSEPQVSQAINYDVKNKLRTLELLEHC